VRYPWYLFLLEAELNRHEFGKDVSPTPVRYPWYLFLLEAELNRGSYCDRKD